MANLDDVDRRDLQDDALSPERVLLRGPATGESEQLDLLREADETLAAMQAIIERERLGLLARAAGLFRDPPAQI